MGGSRDADQDGTGQSIVRRRQIPKPIDRAGRPPFMPAPELARINCNQETEREPRSTPDRPRRWLRINHGGRELMLKTTIDLVQGQKERT